MKRLPGIVVSAVLLILLSLFQVLGAALMTLSGVIESHGLAVAATTNAPPKPAWLPWVSFGMAALCAGLAALGITTSIGLFRMRRWARYLVLIIGGCLAVFCVPGMLMMLVMTLVPLPMPAAADPAHAHTIQFFSKIIFVVISLFSAALAAIGIWWLVYFNRKAVREAFAGMTGSFAPSRRPLLISVLSVLDIVGAVMCTIMAFIPFPFLILGFTVRGPEKTLVLLAFAAANAFAGIGLWRLLEAGRLTAIGVQLSRSFELPHPDLPLQCHAAIPGKK